MYFCCMEQLRYSFIIPVFNRPQEVEEFLESFTSLKGHFDYEIVLVEDGSTETAEAVVQCFQNDLHISYYVKENTGPGASRNYGMERAKGNYFIILDSDVILPPNYLANVDAFLQSNYYDCFGGPDAAHTSFSNLQKAINFSMTSFLTTGGIRGGGELIENFQPRSFNMGLSKRAFKASKGFGKIHPGEDPDLALRLQALGFKTILIKNATVFHKRRISFGKFYKQVYKFGQVRPILNTWHPKSKSVVFWFPTLFCLGLLTSIMLLVLGFKYPAYAYLLYFVCIVISAVFKTKSLIIGLQALLAVIIQFFGYGYGFLKATLKLIVFNKTVQELFPKLFFK